MKAISDIQSWAVVNKDNEVLALYKTREAARNYKRQSFFKTDKIVKLQAVGCVR